MINDKALWAYLFWLQFPVISDPDFPIVGCVLHHPPLCSGSVRLISTFALTVVPYLGLQFGGLEDSHKTYNFIHHHTKLNSENLMCKLYSVIRTHLFYNKECFSNNPWPISYDFISFLFWVQAYHHEIVTHNLDLFVSIVPPQWIDLLPDSFHMNFLFPH